MRYAKHYTDRLELLWGKGFLSPGGSEEVKEILSGVNLSNRKILDIGCGVGGVDVVLVLELGAECVVAVDVEPQLIERTKALATELGIGNRIDARLVEPGPLPFDDSEFDIVFSKDTIAHVPDKLALISEAYRVLRRGGTFAASDWLAADHASEEPAWHALAAVAGGLANVATQGSMLEMMRSAGFEAVHSIDRRAWYAEKAEAEMRCLDGPLRDQMIEIAGREEFNRWHSLRAAMSEAAKSGVLGPVILRGAKSF